MHFHCKRIQMMVHWCGQRGIVPIFFQDICFSTELSIFFLRNIFPLNHLLKKFFSFGAIWDFTKCSSFFINVESSIYNERNEISQKRFHEHFQYAYLIRLGIVSPIYQVYFYENVLNIEPLLYFNEINSTPSNISS